MQATQADVMEWCCGAVRCDEAWPLYYTMVMPKEFTL